MMLLPIEMMAQAHSNATPIDWSLRPIQLGCGGSPWRVAIVSMLKAGTDELSILNCVTKLFESFQRPVDLSKASWVDVAERFEFVPHPWRRARNIVKFSTKWLEPSWTDLRDLPGCNAYVADCVGVFCFGDLNIESKDDDLREFVLRVQQQIA
jgi:endonuclease III